MPNITGEYAMARRSTKQKDRIKWGKSLYVLFQAILFIYMVYFVSKNKFLIILIVFEILDILKNIATQSFEFFPFELRFVFGIAASYYYSPTIGIIIFCLGLINRAAMVHIRPSDFTKALRHFPLFFLTAAMGRFNFFTVALLALSLNYMMKYILRLGYESQGVFDDVVYLAINFVGASLIFYLLGMIYYYLPFLM
ncbi:hypothetical protein JXC34_05045 [Candidatus Woesearchaeota archaeon]|nr:hypothetical protein [Candidatus Woesearchaeota archaeon]